MPASTDRSYLRVPNGANIVNSNRTTLAIHHLSTATNETPTDERQIWILNSHRDFIWPQCKFAKRVSTTETLQPSRPYNRPQPGSIKANSPRNLHMMMDCNCSRSTAEQFYSQKFRIATPVNVISHLNVHLTQSWCIYKSAHISRCSGGFHNQLVSINFVLLFIILNGVDVHIL